MPQRSAITQILTASIILNAWTTSAPGQDALDRSRGVHSCGHAKRLLAQLSAAELAEATPPGGQPHEGSPGDPTDLLHNNLVIEVFPPTKSLAGENTLTLISQVDGLTGMDVRLRENFTISAVEVNGAPADWERLSITTIHVSLNPPIPLNEMFSVRVAYAGPVVSLGMGSIAFTSANGQPLVYTLSEPFYAYTWWPNKESLRDKSTADLRFIVPESLYVASNGVLQSIESLSGARKRFHWKTNYPTITYLYAFAAHPYQIVQDSWTYGTVNMPVEIYAFADSNLGPSQSFMPKLKSMLTVFSDLFGVYPFSAERYAIARFTWGGGMEHQTCSFQSSLSDWLSAHELAHQWWGDQVTCATWNDLWLNEGFASYCEALWEEFKSGQSDPAALKLQMQLQWVLSDDPVYQYSYTNPLELFTPAVYDKGAWALHMLRRVVGDQAFFQALRDYAETYRYQSATTLDLEAVFEQSTGRELSWYFDQWVFSGGYPIYAHGFQTLKAGSRWYAEIQIAQSQSTDWPTYQMPVELAVTGPATDLRRFIWNDQRSEHYLVEVPSGSVNGIALEPDRWILQLTTGLTPVAGPPKIVEFDPPLEQIWTAGQVDTVSILFHRPVEISASDVELLDPHGQPLAFELLSVSGTPGATLLLPAPLKSGQHTLRVRDTVRGVGTDLALDGELPGSVLSSASGPALLLPSGDGQPGGDAVATLTVALAGDLNGDLVVDDKDLGLLLNCMSGGGETIDLNADGACNDSDLGLLLDNFGQS